MYLTRTMAATTAALVLTTGALAAPEAAVAANNGTVTKSCRTVATPYTGVRLTGTVMTYYDLDRRETRVAVTSTPPHGTTNHRNPNGRAKVTNYMWMSTPSIVAKGRNGKAMRKVRTTWSHGVYGFVVKGQPRTVSVAWNVYQKPANKTVDRLACSTKF